MKLEAEITKISGSDRAAVIKRAIEFCKENRGYEVWRDIERRFILFKWVWLYEIELYKPLNFKLINKNYASNTRER